MTRARNAWILAVLAVVVIVAVTMDTGRASTGYSNFSLRGTYRVAYAGISVAAGKPESGVGVFVADGTGGISGVESYNGGGQLCQDVAVNGTYDVQPNGMGTMTATFSSPVPGCSGEFSLGFVVLKGGDLVKAFGAGSGFVTLSEDWFRD
jgi:hypothetical protein